MSEVQGGSACGPSTLWRSEVAVPMVCAEVLLPHVFDYAGSAGVVFGLTRSSLLPLLLEFLLLWLVRDWLSLLSLVREAHPPTLFRKLRHVQSECPTVQKRIQPKWRKDKPKAMISTWSEEEEDEEEESSEEDENESKIC
ncbi:hypothetical protein Taro_053799 [Colocasia esculenta]|uniref:Uncharacterized protein n=1 Tax=Colocasia esculenta TaxID=4460 RepID=A0A843XNP5_COLES|nr:hypothetical protein [Colocasia esculenta]